MAYQIKRADRLIETLEFVSRSGDVAMQIDVNIEISRIASHYRAHWIKVVEAQKKFADGDNPEQALEALGVAVIETYNLIFGEGPTAKMLEFFEGDYEEMLEQTLPFVRDIVMPSIQQYTEQKVRSLKAKYKRK